MQRFTSISESFRFFDKNYNNKVNFSEFTQTMEELKVKMSLTDQLQVFNSLAGSKGYITFDEYRNLSYERRIKLEEQPTD